MDWLKRIIGVWIVCKHFWSNSKISASISSLLGTPWGLSCCLKVERSFLLVYFLPLQIVKHFVANFQNSPQWYFEPYPPDQATFWPYSPFPLLIIYLFPSILPSIVNWRCEPFVPTLLKPLFFAYLKGSILREWICIPVLFEMHCCPYVEESLRLHKLPWC